MFNPVLMTVATLSVIASIFFSVAQMIDPSTKVWGRLWKLSISISILFFFLATAR